MTSPDGNAEGQSQLKKRRIPGACDICKRKKIRCDSGEMPDNRCTNCVQYGLECTHKEVTKTLGSAKGYVEGLEARLEKMDRLLSKLLPGIDIHQQVEKMDATPSPPPEPELLPRNDDETPDTMVTMQLNRLTLNPKQNRFFGKSSGYQLVQTALDLKQEYVGERIPRNRTLIPLKRFEFWEIPPWVTRNPDCEPAQPEYIFPEEDLMSSLINIYFEHVNQFLPLLHRPTLERLISEGLHHEDQQLGGVVLMVCALGSRFSDDPRVFADGFDAPRSAGWKYYEQATVLRKSLYRRTTLYELQLHALHILFRQSSETPQGVWAQIGLAIRLCQEVGAHRRRPRAPDTPPSAEDELWKRAFWVLMCIDRHISSFAGRPCGLQDEDFDLDLPLECDDEYWENGFQQPAGKPSYISFFNAYLRLVDILAYAMRLIYSIKRPRNTFGRPPLSEQQVIVELDSAMNSWMDSVPEHLRWNPSCDKLLFLKQSATLYATYYYLQIFIHRPFIPSPRNPIPLSFPSLAICTNAARSCCHVLESFTKHGPIPFSFIQNTAFTAAVILLLNIWSGKRTGYAPNPKREMEDVQRCRQILKASELRYASAGRYWDILTELAFAGDVAIPSPNNNTTSPSPNPNSTANNTTSAAAPRQQKRSRDADEDAGTSVSPPASPIDVHFRAFAGSRRVSATASASTATSPTHSTPTPPTSTAPGSPAPPALFSLPMYGNELGRLPIYGQFNFSDVVDPHARGVLPASASFNGGAMHGVQHPQQGFGQSMAGQAHAHTHAQTVMLDTNGMLIGGISQPCVPGGGVSMHSNGGSGMYAGGAGGGMHSAYLLDPAFGSSLGAAFGGAAPGCGSMAHGYAQLGQAGQAHAQQQQQTPLSPLNGMGALFGGSMQVSNGGGGGGGGGLNFDSMSLFGTMPAMDNDMMTMWSTAPTSLEPDDWNRYISNVEQLTQAQAHAQRRAFAG